MFAFLFLAEVGLLKAFLYQVQKCFLVKNIFKLDSICVSLFYSLALLIFFACDYCEIRTIFCLAIFFLVFALYCLFVFVVIQVGLVLNLFNFCGWPLK